jgi:hypothetical protein
MATANINSPLSAAEIAKYEALFAFVPENDLPQALSTDEIADGSESTPLELVS